MQKPPHPGVDLHKHASGTMPMNRICSQRGFAISPTHNEQKWLFKRQMDAEKSAFQQV